MKMPYSTEENRQLKEITRKEKETAANSSQGRNEYKYRQQPQHLHSRRAARVKREKLYPQPQDGQPSVKASLLSPGCLVNGITYLRTSQVSLHHHWGGGQK